MFIIDGVPTQPKLVDVPTCLVWCWWFVVDPLDDLKTILSCHYGDAGDAGDEVLQGNAPLQCLVAQMQRAELRCITVWKAKWKIGIYH